jgi:hypothetical protein
MQRLYERIWRAEKLSFLLEIVFLIDTTAIKKWNMLMIAAQHSRYGYRASKPTKAKEI